MHVHAGLALGTLATLWGMLAGILPEIAGLTLLGISKLATGIAWLTATGHAHLMRAAQDTRERFVSGIVTVAALTLLVWCLAIAWGNLSPTFLGFLALLAALSFAVLRKKKVAP